ncbi:SDR family oxidoreductase [Thermaerobacter litoralis]
MADGDLAGQAWLITGGAGAIAGAIARAFAGAGARLALADLPGEALVSRAREVGAVAFPVDLTQAGASETMARQVHRHLGRIDGLIHTVGTYAGGRIQEVDPAQYERLFDVNVRTLFHAVRAVLPFMLEQGGGFIAGFAAGPAWRGAGPRAALYAAAKAAVATFLRSLDAEAGEAGIRVVVVYPMGVVDTPANRQAMPEADPRGWIDPGEIAAALRFAATRGPGGRLLELPVYPGRNRHDGGNRHGDGA